MSFRFISFWDDEEVECRRNESSLKLEIGIIPLYNFRETVPFSPLIRCVDGVALTRPTKWPIFLILLTKFSKMDVFENNSNAKWLCTNRYPTVLFFNSTIFILFYFFAALCSPFLLHPFNWRHILYEFFFCRVFFLVVGRHNLNAMRLSSHDIDSSCMRIM